MTPIQGKEVNSPFPKNLSLSRNIIVLSLTCISDLYPSWFVKENVEHLGLILTDIIST